MEKYLPVQCSLIYDQAPGTEIYYSRLHLMNFIPDNAGVRQQVERPTITVKSTLPTDTVVSKADVEVVKDMTHENHRNSIGSPVGGAWTNNAPLLWRVSGNEGG